MRHQRDVNALQRMGAFDFVQAAGVHEAVHVLLSIAR
jgi:hypothetical protein